MPVAEVQKSPVLPSSGDKGADQILDLCAKDLIGKEGLVRFSVRNPGRINMLLAVGRNCTKVTTLILMGEHPDIDIDDPDEMTRVKVIEEAVQKSPNDRYFYVKRLE